MSVKSTSRIDLFTVLLWSNYGWKKWAVRHVRRKE